MEKKITVIMCEVGKEPYVKEIPNEIKPMQEFVGRHIETAPLTQDGLIVVCNNNGLRLNLPINYNLGLQIFGNFFVVRVKGVDFISITNDDIEFLNKK